MTRDIKRLRTVEDLFASREQAAARDLGRFTATLEDARAQLASLRRYRDEYRGASVRTGATDPSRLLNEHAFAQRLDRAIAEQEALVQRAEADCEALRARYRATRQRTKAVGKVCERRVDAHRQAEARREQKESDERGARPRKR